MQRFERQLVDRLQFRDFKFAHRMFARFAATSLCRAQRAACTHHRSLHSLRALPVLGRVRYTANGAVAARRFATLGENSSTPTTTTAPPTTTTTTAATPTTATATTPARSVVVDMDASATAAAAKLNVSSESITSRYMVREMLKYIWPRGDYSTKLRVVGALSLLMAAKVLFFLFFLVVDFGY